MPNDLTVPSGDVHEGSNEGILPNTTIKMTAVIKENTDRFAYAPLLVEIFVFGSSLNSPSSTLFRYYLS